MYLISPSPVVSPFLFVCTRRLRCPRVAPSSCRSGRCTPRSNSCRLRGRCRQRVRMTKDGWRSRGDIDGVGESGLTQSQSYFFLGQIITVCACSRMQCSRAQWPFLFLCPHVSNDICVLLLVPRRLHDLCDRQDCRIPDGKWRRQRDDTAQADLGAAAMYV